VGWRDKYKVHPAADVFPMMSDEELDALGQDIKKNGLRSPIWFQNTAETTKEDILLDGRNRLEAIERAGISPWLDKHYHAGDPVAFIISLNIHRRHLNKAEQADLIVAAIKAGKPTQVESVSKGGRGKVNPVKQAAIATGEEHGISSGTMNRALAKAEGRAPKPKPVTTLDSGTTVELAEPEPEEDEYYQSEVDDIDPKQCRSGYLMRASVAKTNARDCAELLRILRTSQRIGKQAELMQAAKDVVTTWQRLLDELLAILDGTDAKGTAA
jgi:hypothetical protein